MKIPEIVMPLVKKNTANTADDDNPIKEKFQGPAELKKSIMAAEEQVNEKRRKQIKFENEQEEKNLEK